MDRQACPRNNITTNEIFPINKAFSTDCIISPIKTEITGNDFSQFPFFHLPAIQGKSGDNNSWYPALMEAQAGTPFFSEISSPFPDTVSVFPATVNTAGNQAARLLPQRIVLHRSFPRSFLIHVRYNLCCLSHFISAGKNARTKTARCLNSFSHFVIPAGNPMRILPLFYHSAQRIPFQLYPCIRIFRPDI